MITADIWHCAKILFEIAGQFSSVTEIFGRFIVKSSAMKPPLSSILLRCIVLSFVFPIAFNIWFLDAMVTMGIFCNFHRSSKTPSFNQSATTKWFLFVEPFKILKQPNENKKASTGRFPFCRAFQIFKKTPKQSFFLWSLLKLQKLPNKVYFSILWSNSSGCDSFSDKTNCWSVKNAMNLRKVYENYLHQSVVSTTV